MISIRDKRADEKLLSIWMFINWGLIGVMIILGVVIFFSSQNDSRSVEANILGVKILDCLSQNFNFKEVSSQNFNLADKCSINKNILESSGKYYVTLIFSEVEAGVVSKESFNLNPVGESSLGQFCNAQKNPDYKDRSLAGCSYQSIRLLDESTNKLYQVNLSVSSNQHG